MWSALFITLPTQPNAVRLRLWRGLKALGCASLRDGTYLLPDSQASSFDTIAREALDHGGSATVLTLSPRDDQQRSEILALFDRSAQYAEWRDTVQAVHGELDRLGETDARRRLRAVSEALGELQRIDYYPGAAADQAQAELSALRQALDARFSRGEPHTRAGDGIERLEISRFQGKRWATRARPWVDRLACAWVIRRMIDPQARFIWLDDPAKAPRSALGFDYDGARFTHVGNRVSFEVILASFALESDPKLQRIAAAVHYLDVGGIPSPEAAGLETVLAGLREIHADDDALLDAACAIFDALHAAPGLPT